MAARYRIPHSVFLSWDADDRDKAIWQHVRERQTCGGCGTRRAEWDPAQGGRADAYTPKAEQCPGCARIEVLSKGLPEGAGHRIVLVPNVEEEVSRAQA
ncbi:hypothetical protein HNP84_000231 [Thermocatellispora tengchongensis]|uniref:Uncharacterized protein n=1 Tax=Thermocatellispora tengchongensis TaxID=1073253 RepID=A0A840NXX2_9ACTN|nr:hypothetical protein [Thermocatellispora tengchongensis]MBB5130543.1 hypothetical protein [Thermocatellispora tengchongensis]